jgi:hypothetical protein
MSENHEFCQKVKEEGIDEAIILSCQLSIIKKSGNERQNAINETKSLEESRLKLKEILIH